MSRTETGISGGGALRAIARPWRAFVQTARRFAGESRGGLAPFFAVSIIPLIAFIGLGTDTARGYILKSRLSYALDAAGLAGGRVMYSSTRDSDIAMYFNANFPPGYMHATVDGPHFTVTPDNEKIELNASATIGTTFLRVLGIDTMTVSAATEVTRETDMLDVVLSMDLSGSMAQTIGGVPKIQSARDAANALVDVLFGANAQNSLLHIGLVPWNGKVNISTNGVAYDSAATVQDTSVGPFVDPVTGGSGKVWTLNNSEVPVLGSSKPPSGWKGCVYARYVNDGISNNDADTMEGILPNVGGKAWIAWEPVLPSSEPSSTGGTCWGCTPCLQYGVTTLTDTKQTIVDAINALQTPGGHTDIPQGLDMAWQVLVSDAPYTEAVANPPGNRQRAIVIMTDGYNTQAYGDAYKHALTPSQLDDRLKQVADNIKATMPDIQIYAIQFGDAPTAAQADLMRYVASDPKDRHYFYAPDGATLNSIFHQIANDLSELRLSK